MAKDLSYSVMYDLLRGYFLSSCRNLSRVCNSSVWTILLIASHVAVLNALFIV